ncbi:putative signaling protein [Thalassocella blandensis]|nr:putative signaling protein [Thalassocella blandensis]
MSNWYLEGFFGNDGLLSQRQLKILPQVLGRNEALSLTISAPSVSRNHARIEQRENQLWIVDLDSRNGTFVNRKQINAPTQIDHGDVLHFGTAEMRLIDSEHSTSRRPLIKPGHSDDTTFLSAAELSQAFPSGVRELEQLINNRQLKMVYQPIILAADLSISGFEILGRGDHPGLPPSPFELFRIAESFKLEVTLSEVMRNVGIENAARYKLPGDLLVNTHPSEMLDPDRLLADLQKMRKRFPGTPVTLEIHEQSVTDNTDLLREVKSHLEKLQIKLAFDDFGVGQSRLMEMVEAKPDLIKFDKVLIENLDSADASRANLLRHLVDLANTLHINTLAECVETEGEYLVCKTMNFEFYQGYYFAKPQAAQSFT